MWVEKLHSTGPLTVHIYVTYVYIEEYCFDIQEQFYISVHTYTNGFRNQ